jgi:hypothetical protein
MSENTQETVQETTTQQPAADLSVNDLAALKSIIDVASARGAFKPNEMTTIGQVYDKLSAFLDQIVKQAEATTDEGAE